MPKNMLAKALSFSHLTGASKKSEDKDEDKKAEQEEKDKDDQDREDGDARRAADDKDEHCAEDDDQDEGEDDDDKKKGKKSKKAEDDDDDENAEDDDDNDEEMRGKSAAASARRRERARCAAIFASPAAARNIPLTCKLAFATALPRKEAIDVLASAPAAPKGNADRQARNPNIGAGGTLAANSEQAIASRWDGHMKKAQGVRRR